jgi:hypothetical protein
MAMFLKNVTFMLSCEQMPLYDLTCFSGLVMLNL